MYNYRENWLYRIVALGWDFKHTNLQKGSNEINMIYLLMRTRNSLAVFEPAIFNFFLFLKSSCSTCGKEINIFVHNISLSYIITICIRRELHFYEIEVFYEIEKKSRPFPREWWQGYVACTVDSGIRIKIQFAFVVHYFILKRSQKPFKTPIKHTHTHSYAYIHKSLAHFPPIHLKSHLPNKLS